MNHVDDELSDGAAAAAAIAKADEPASQQGSPLPHDTVVGRRLNGSTKLHISFIYRYRLQVIYRYRLRVVRSSCRLLRPLRRRR